MRESGSSLNTDRKRPLLLLVSGKLLKKKQLCSIAKLWMLSLTLFLWRNLRESLMLRLLILLGISLTQSLSLSLSLSHKMTHLLSLKLTNYPKIYTVRDLGVIPSCSLFWFEGKGNDLKCFLKNFFFYIFFLFSFNFKIKKKKTKTASF